MVRFYLDYKIIGFANGFYYIHDDGSVTEHPLNTDVSIDGKKYLYKGTYFQENDKYLSYNTHATYTSPFQYFKIENDKFFKYEDDEFKEIQSETKIEIYYDKYYYKDGLLYFYNYFKTDQPQYVGDFTPGISNLGNYDIIKPTEDYPDKKPDFIKQNSVSAPKRRQTLLAQQQQFGTCFAHSVARSISKTIKSYSIKHNFGPLIDTETTVDECDQKHIDSENPETYDNILSNEKCINNPSRNYALLYSYILKLVEYYFGTNGGQTGYILEFFSKHFNYIVNCKRKKQILTPSLDLESVKMLNEFTTELVKNGDHFSFKYANIEDNDKSDYNWIINPENKGDFNDTLSIKQLIKSNTNYCSFSVGLNNIQGIKFYLIAFLQKRNIPINDNDENITDENKLRDVADYYNIRRKTTPDKPLKHALTIIDWDDKKGITFLNTWGYNWGNRGKIVIKDHKLLGSRVTFSYLFISKKESEKKSKPIFELCTILNTLIEDRNKDTAQSVPLQIEKLTNGIGLLVDTEFGIYNQIKNDFSDSCKKNLENVQRELNASHGGKKRTIKQKHTLRKTTRKNLRRSKIKSQRITRFSRGSSKMKRVRNSRK
jgi:hypothetical protein